MPESKDLDLFSRMLTEPVDKKIYSDPLMGKVIQKGVLVSLGEEGSPEAIQLLYTFIAGEGESPLGRLGLKILDRLAAAENTPARNALCRLVIQKNLETARQLAINRQLAPDDPLEKAEFLFLTGQFSKYELADPEYWLITSAYLQVDPEVKKRLAASAREAGLDEWARVMATLQNPTESALGGLVSEFPHFKSEKIKNLVVHSLSNLAQQESQPAQDALCQLFTIANSDRVLDIVLEKGYLPSNPAQRALFYLLTGQMEKYEELDFDRALIASVYGPADKAMRQRIMTQIQRSGHPDWMKGITGNSRIRFVNDLTDADWSAAIASLQEKHDWADLWKLAQVSPPFWSAAILKWLYEVDRIPQLESQGGVAHLLELAQGCTLPPTADPINTLLGHSLEVTCLAYEPSRDFLVSGSADQTLRVWDFDSGNLHNLVSYPGRQIRSLAASPNGDLVAVSTDDHNIQVIDLSSNRFVKSFQGHTSTVKGIAITPDGWFLVSGSFDKTIKVWRFPYGPELKTISEKMGEIFCLTVSPDRRYIFSGGADHAVRVWTLPDGAAFKALDGHTDTVTWVAASQDSRFLASSSRDNTIRVWNIPSGAIYKEALPQSSLPTCLIFAPDPQILFSGHLDGTISIWNISTGNKILSIPAHQAAVTGLVLNQDSTILASSSNDRSIKLWDISAIILSRIPVDRYSVLSVREAQEKLKEKHLSTSNRSWLQFSLEMYQFRKRFDIEIGEPEVIEAGNFDIEL